MAEPQSPAVPGRRALITGLGGFLGSNLALHLARHGWSVWGSWHGKDPGLAGVQARHLDVCVPAEVDALVAESAPEVVFHLAAIAQPDACADDEPAARHINVQGAKIVAKAARRAGAALVFTSTDQVFDGSRALWSESDVPEPLGAYGRSKRDAEKAVLEASDGEALVLRLALTYGWGRGGAHGRNFAEQWLKTLLTGGRVPAFTDQWRTPIYAEDACEAMRLGAERGWKGLLHLAGPERASRHDFAVRLAREFRFPAEQMQAASLKDMVFRDPRPADASLDTARLRSLGFEARGLDQGLKDMHLALEKL
ncbi:MAG TPA: NAD(P)-dependent oxidoreductase [bacterium]|jgi:dTDP-4-dehydrorhamnose reductase|nr:NAD(P)-dependent oxidoreductase [bacterium]